MSLFSVIALILLPSFWGLLLIIGELYLLFTSKELQNCRDFVNKSIASVISCIKEFILAIFVFFYFCEIVAGIIV